MFPSSILSNFENNEKAATPPTNGTTINFGPKKNSIFSKKFGAAIKIFGKNSIRSTFGEKILVYAFTTFPFLTFFSQKTVHVFKWSKNVSIEI